MIWTLVASVGSCSAQMGCAIGQRVRKRHPEGVVIGLGTSPVKMMRSRLWPGTGCGIADSLQVFHAQQLGQLSDASIA